MNETEEKEWTLMFYFASDNPLAPSIVSQLKALKNAGFHQLANVVARFDPHTVGTPLHTFDVNLVEKAEARARARIQGQDPDDANQIGFPSDNPFIRNLVLDKLWGDATIPKEDGGEERITDCIRKKILYNLQRSAGLPRQANQVAAPALRGLIEYEPPNPNEHSPSSGESNGAGGTPVMAGDPAGVSAPPNGEGRANGQGATTQAVEAEKPDKATPKESLNDFLQFCARKYPAKRYMLFILGHGLIVGNDMFLFDEHAKKPSLSLKELGDVLVDFNTAINKDRQEGEDKKNLTLLGFHSCSMSSIEVAYELQGMAKYMLASQGPEFVGSWPYTQILVRIFRDLNQDDPESTVKKIFQYCYFNSYDFQLAGYSSHLCLCDLDKVSSTQEHIQNLVAVLNDALGNEKSADVAAGDKRPGDEFVKDLILLAHWDAQSFWRETYLDLYDFCLCLHTRCANTHAYVSAETQAQLKQIQEKCSALMTALCPQGGEGLVLRSGFAGPSYQYSRGLSVYFPWSQPSNEDFWPTEYKGYKFEETGWRDFLQRYFDNTMRDPRVKLEGDAQSYASDNSFTLNQTLLEGITGHIFERGEPGQLGKGGGSDATGKGGGSDASGDDCDCPSIKNYPSFTRARRRRVSGGGEWKEEKAYVTPTGSDLSEAGDYQSFSSEDAAAS
ncbi:MAG TPA: clostripain-related cysteine peptidase [Pyrinomonadaceae bacterium]|nr:clostripain-related cysteine peptidase [Pyrinomonadaceae bacterium]